VAGAEERAAGAAAAAGVAAESTSSREVLELRTKVGRCKLRVSKPALKARLVSALDSKLR